MSLDEIEDRLEPVKQTIWLDKKSFVGKSLNCEIAKVSRINKDVVLHLLYNGNSEPELLRINDKMLNELIARFGNASKEWIGNGVTLEFKEFTPKPGSSVSPGVSCSLVWEEEEEIEA